MKFWQSFLVVFILLFNLIFLPSAQADAPRFKKNPDYIELTKTLQTLSATEQTPETTQQIANLEFLKYSIESGSAWGQCTNKTGKTLAVYGSDPNADDDYKPVYDNQLYFLADGQTSEQQWDCDGFYLPSDVKAVNTNGEPEEITGPVAVKIFDGIQLLVTINPDTGNLEFNAPLSKVLQVGQANWYIPKVAQATVDTRVPNVPTQQS